MPALGVGGGEISLGVCREKRLNRLKTLSLQSSRKEPLCNKGESGEHFPEGSYFPQLGGGREKNTKKGTFKGGEIQDSQKNPRVKEGGGRK